MTMAFCISGYGSQLNIIKRSVVKVNLNMEGGDKMLLDIVKILVPIIALYVLRVVGVDPCTLIEKDHEKHVSHDTTFYLIPASPIEIDSGLHWEYPLRR